MTSSTLQFNNLASSFLLIIIIVIGAGPLSSASPSKGEQTTSAARSADVTGTWSGTFFPKHANVSSFAMTIEITQDTPGILIGSASLNSDCLKGVQLQVTVTGSKVVLAGSDERGANITVRGTLDKTGTLMKSTYIMNGGATGGCETDNGSGDLSKR